VRDLSLNYSVFIRKSLDKVLINKKILSRQINNGIRFELIDIPKSMKVLIKDLRSKSSFFYKKIN